MSSAAGRGGWLVVASVASLASARCGGDDEAAGQGGAATGTSASVGSGATAGAGGGGAQQPSPLTCVDVDCGPSMGATVALPAGADLQAAIDAASPGDVLVLDAGASYVGNFVLSEKNGDACITIRTSTTDADLPVDVRVTPGDAPKLARVVSPGNGLPAIRTSPRAHNYRLVGLEIMPETAATQINDLVDLGDGSETTVADLPHHLVIERSFIHGWPDANFKRGIGLNGTHTCIIHSTISDFHSDFQDSQAIGCFNGAGPFRIINNRLEGSAENVMLGGATPAINGLVPTDVIIRGNHFYKPLSWKAGDPANTGYTPWVKNLFEIKNGRDVVFEGNVLENNWVGADQHGYAIVLTPRGENGAAPWATVENVTIRSNLIRHVGGGVAIAGRDDGGPSQQSTGITIANNVFEDIRQDYALDIVRVLQFNEVAGLTVDHNTYQFAPGSWPMLRTFGNQTTGFVYTSNVIEYREGVWSDCGNDAMALSCKLPGAVFDGNVIIGGPSGAFPGSNHTPATIADVGFGDYSGAASDYHGYALAPGSAYAGGGADGNDPGIDPATIDAARGTATPP